MGPRPSLARQIGQVLLTYVTHYWVMAGIAGWLVLIVAPQLLLGIAGGSRQSDLSSLAPFANFVVAMPLFFAALMLVPQVKAQFCHPRSRLVPGFVTPHLAVIAGLLLLMVGCFPLLAAVCCHFDPLGTMALATAILAASIWAAHFNRMLGMLAAIALFYSALTKTGTKWWLLGGSQHWPIHAAILLVGATLLAIWLRRLAMLHEELDDYRTVVQWRTSRKPGSETAEQRRSAAEQFGRNRWFAALNDHWLAGVGAYHGDRLLWLPRLLRFGFGQRAEVNGLLMGVWFAAITLFIAKFSYGSRGPTDRGFGAILFFMQFGPLIPGFFAGDQLAQRRPRIASELLRPLSRTQLVDGLLAATIWQWAGFWVSMNLGLFVIAWWTQADQFTPVIAVVMSIVSATASFALCGLTTRTAVWSSVLRRMMTLMIAAGVFQIPVIFWLIGRKDMGDIPSLLLSVVMVLVGGALFRSARSAWLELELG